MPELKPPFSAQYKGQHAQVDNSFPKTAIIGLIHILQDLEERSFIAGWPAIARELQRIGRKPLVVYEERTVKDSKKSMEESEIILLSLPWEKIFDFCERLHSHLARSVEQHIGYDEVPTVLTERSEVQAFISTELGRLFLEEHLAYEFSDGTVRRRGRKHSEDQNTRAQVVLGDPMLFESKTHFLKALRFFRHASQPDYENCVKEAVCAVESVGKVLFPQAQAKTLGDLLNWFSSKSSCVEIPQTLIKTFQNIYAFRNGGVGVSHGGAHGGTATVEVAEFVLAICASQIIFLVDLASIRDEVPI